MLGHTDAVVVERKFRLHIGGIELIHRRRRKVSGVGHFLEDVVRRLVLDRVEDERIARLPVETGDTDQRADLRTHRGHVHRLLAKAHGTEVRVLALEFDLDFGRVFVAFFAELRVVLVIGFEMDLAFRISRVEPTTHELESAALVKRIACGVVGVVWTETEKILIMGE